MSQAALERLALYFAGEATRQGILARLALRRSSPEDLALAAQLAARAAAELRADGSLNGAGLPTIWRVHELLDLDTPAGFEAAGRGLQWILQLQGKPGAYGEGCDRERHARRLCEHHLTGFFSPAPPTERLAPITLPNGKVYRAEPAARFAIGCLAVRAVLRGGLGDRNGIRRHLDSLALLAEQLTTWTGYFAPDLLVATMHVMAAAGHARGETAHRLAGLTAASQQPDGTWAGADLFHVLEALRAAGTSDALAATRRAVPALVARQRTDGTFGPSAQQERALIGVRALVWAQQAA